MTNLYSHVIVGSGKKQDHRSGKERQCCRYIRTVSRIYIARVIFRVRLCPQLIKLNGLFRHALTRPDQVDIWDQVPPCAYWNNQINRSINAETAACPKRQAVFLCVAMSHAQAIYKWIHGTSMPTIDNLVILAAMLGVTLDEIVVVETAAMKCG